VTIPLDPREGRRLYGADPRAYSVGRPDYPPRVYEILADCGLRLGCQALEIGPGSGLVTRHLLAIGAQVTAVEASAEMAAHLRDEFPGQDLQVLRAPFEEAVVPAGSFDLAVAATSFHWVAQPGGWQNLFRCLRVGGWVVIWWMLFQDPTAPDDFDLATHEVLGGSPSRPEHPEATPFQIDVEAREAEMSAAGLVDVGSELIRATYTFGPAELRALYATTATVLRRPAAEQQLVLDRLEELVRDRHQSRVERRFLTALYRGRKAAESRLMVDEATAEANLSLPPLN
jgi:SAM-dependent methyltransferase